MNNMERSNFELIQEIIEKEQDNEIKNLLRKIARVLKVQAARVVKVQVVRVVKIQAARAARAQKVQVAKIAKVQANPARIQRQTKHPHPAAL